MLHTAIADWAAFKLYEAIMAFYNPAAKEAILYYAQVMAGSWGYKPIVYAKRMGWLDGEEKVTVEGQKLA